MWWQKPNQGHAMEKRQEIKAMSDVCGFCWPIFALNSLPCSLRRDHCHDRRHFGLLYKEGVYRGDLKKLGTLVENAGFEVKEIQLIGDKTKVLYLRGIKK
jgi:hypothetical protein